MLKKVIHITTVHIPFDQRIFHRECQSLKKIYDVGLICNHDIDEVIDGIEIIPLQKGKPAKNRVKNLYIRIINNIRAYQKALRSNADVFHLHDPELLPVALCLKKRTDAIVIFDSHEDNSAFMEQKEYIPRYLRGMFKFIVSYFEVKAARKLDAIITADQGVEEKFLNLGANSKAIYNFPRLDYFEINYKSISKVYDLVYHGSVPKYHFQNILEIDDELVRRKYHLKWYIFGKIASLAWVKEQIRQRKAESRIIIGDRVEHNLVAKEVAKARIGLIPLPDLPKFQFNIPTKLFEYMSLEMPVVLSDLPPSRPFVEGNECAFMVPSDSYSSYADKIIALIENEEMYVSMGKKGKKLTEEDFNWNSQEKQLLAFYNNLLNEK